MKLIDKNGIKFQSHNFENDNTYNRPHLLAYTKRCINCNFSIYYPVSYSEKLCESIFTAFGCQLNSNNKFGKNYKIETFFVDLSMSCEEQIIKNIIE